MRSVIILALVVRQVLRLMENLSLARHLEARLVERTTELRASEQRFQALVQHSSEVVTLIGAGGKIDYERVDHQGVRLREAHLRGRHIAAGLGRRGRGAAVRGPAKVA